MNTVRALGPLAIAGWALLGLGLTIYIGGMLMRLFRVSRQYSLQMKGAWALRLGAIFDAAARFWPFLLLAASGGVLLYLSR